MSETSDKNVTVCRDCFSVRVGFSARCTACRSIRVVSHPLIRDLSIAHVDCDAFYAAIEKRDNPELAAVPVIVGGGKRGVVSTCCYIARTFGVRSAMPMFQALKACPRAVVIRPRMQVYATEGRKIRDMMLALTPAIEPVSIDEAYLDLSGTERIHNAPPVVSLMRLQKQVESELNLTISVGLASNKFLAKIASEADKPRGFFALSESEAPEYLAPRSVRIIGGVGPVLEKKLAGFGYRVVGDLQKAGSKRLAETLGETGVWLHACAHGQLHRQVTAQHARKSISAETTFFADVSDPKELEDMLWRLAQRTSTRAKASQMDGSVIVLKLKTSSFRTITRQVKLSAPTQLAQTIFRTARPLLLREATGTKFRLLGVGIADLSPAGRDALDLGDPLALRRAAAERAADKARARFGDNAVMSGRSAKSPQKDNT